MKDRQEKGGGFSAARHRACEQIFSLERWRNRVGLNAGWSSETEVFETLEKTGMESETGKWHGSL
jgi:hypothetical protein